MKKLLIVLGIILLVLAGLAGAAWYAFTQLPGSLIGNALAGLKIAELQQEGGGFLSEVKGDVQLERAGVVAQAVNGDKLAAGDQVRVGIGGSAVIIWSGYGRTVLDAGTDLRIDQAEGEDKAGKLNVKMRVHAGRIWTRLQKLLDVGSGFSVQSSNVVATVRGTSFGMSAQGGAATVQVMESNVGMTMEGSADEVLMKPAQAMVMNQGVQRLPNPRPMTESESNNPFVVEGNRTLAQNEMLAPVTLRRLLDALEFPFYGMSKEDLVGFIASLPDISELKMQAPEYFQEVSESDLIIYQRLIDEARAWAREQGAEQPATEIQVETKTELNIN
ncbi:FecR domain-containing protein [Candidatus Uhrbacteria bacterium]|nr:FecR domain-containing protein [Candidatus Uhrbacteria bacterium]